LYLQRYTKAGQDSDFTGFKWPQYRDRARALAFPALSSSDFSTGIARCNIAEGNKYETQYL
jgi:hypothetical protein